TLIGMLLATTGLIVCLDNKNSPDVFPVFLTISVLLFAFTGLGNGAAYQMIPATLRTLHLRHAGEDGPEGRRLALQKAKIETSAAVGFIGAVGAYGGWMIPQTFGLSISITGAPFRALEFILGLYLVCLAVLWNGFLRPDRMSAAGSRLAEAES
ncbi:MAG TPA: MFS transporter, partial [Actinomycetota bacterium]|nr:MFS transporter [Actinomycetota bacterium]